MDNEKSIFDFTLAINFLLNLILSLLEKVLSFLLLTLAEKRANEYDDNDNVNE